MRQVSIFSVKTPAKFLLYALALIFAGCSLEKESGFNRDMQNLTAHYNILFNAKEILRQKQESYATSFVDNYNNILSVYQDTTVQTATPDKDLELAIVKGNTLINFKEQSHYIGDAYLILGKANYLEANYYNAVEYFSYVIRSFPKRKDLVQDARVWKTRTLLFLNKFEEAKPVIDSAIQDINPKKRVFQDIYATKLLYDIDVQEYEDGEQMAKKAVQYSRGETQRLRWTFILSQLQELNGKPGEALKNYAQIAKSNALFEMAFNASLNMIRIEDMQNGVKINRIARLLSLLKNPNNKEFKDQIYYQVAQIQLADKHIDDAIKNYKLSLRATIKNQNQKGLSYLRLAEIYFSEKADYLTAKKYYDSTLTTLPVTYPGYLAIQKKGSNLALLADRLQIIAKEDTLQALARMDEKTRSAVIDKMVSDRILQQQAQAKAAAGSASAADSGPGNSFSGGSFYFDNSTAVGQGYSDFKTKWGTRKLEDDWRRSSRSSGNISANPANSGQGSDPDAPAGQGSNKKNASTGGSYRKELIQGLPLTADQLVQSNLRIYNAYVDIGNFYRDVLDDKKEAIRIYELILKRFPADPNKPAMYYNLYRLYSDIDQTKSDFYKNKLLKEFPETPFAKIITDTDFAKKLNDADAAFTDAYNVVFDLYAHKEYKEVVACVPELLKQYPGNKLSAQLYYLQTIAAGHSEKIGPFKDSLQQIIKMFPGDKLITPLVNQQLAYINANLPDVSNRSVVLADADPHEVPFVLAAKLKEKAFYRSPSRIPSIFATKPGERLPEKKPVASTAPTTQPGKKEEPNKPVVKHPDAMPSIFSMRDSTNYYFVVNVSTGATNLASSRFGIGQFNRANFSDKEIKHALKYVGDDNQLVYVGRFLSLKDAKDYARQIIPLLPDIMKVPADKYSFFMITQENLKKIADKKTLDNYVDYYQNNY